MKIHNKTRLKYSALIDGKEYFLDKSGYIDFPCNENTQVVLRTLDKSYSHLDWLDIIFVGFIGDTTTTQLYCDYSFQIKDCNAPVLTLEYNDWNPRGEYYIRACYANSNVYNEHYSMPHLERIRKKHFNLHIFVTSLWPVGLLLLLGMVFCEPILVFVILFLLWFFIFPFLGIKEIKRFKAASEPNYVNNELCRYAAERRNGDRIIGDDTSKTGKFVEKLLGKMFKFDDKEDK